jgi:Flp pilus assembly protein TadD
MRPYCLKLVVSILLVTAILFVYWPTRNHVFVNYDDPGYVTENRNVQAGLDWDGITWAFSTTHMSNWHPVTFLSHMLDCELFGLDPGGHHLSNVLFHLVNTLLIFMVFERMSGAFWRSAFVAAMFGLHPLHVESVAWVSERKDVLSAFYGILTLWLYFRYVERPGYNRYLLALLAFAMGLMSKPMLVTLPFVLVLLDYWPLGRFPVARPGAGNSATIYQSGSPGGQRRILFRLVCEKVPFFCLAAFSSVVTFIAQKSGGAVSSLEAFPLHDRMANALVSYVMYVVKMIWPQGLAVFYPRVAELPIWWGAASGIVLVCVSSLVFLSARRYPYLVTGWLWYLGMLVPVIGLVQVGNQAMADRYTYLPFIGLFIIMAWGVSDLAARWRYRKVVVGTTAAVLLSTFTIIAWLYTGQWKNSMTLFKHAVEVTAKNYVAHNNLGTALAGQGKLDEAIGHYRKALQIKYGYAKAHNNLGAALAKQGKLDEAIGHYRKALQIKYGYAEAHNNLGLALAGKGKLDAAIMHFSEAIGLQVDYAEAHYNLGVALARKGSLKKAIVHYSEALRIKREYAEAHSNLGIALAQQGRLEEAIAHFSQALRLKPDFREARNNLTRALRLAGEKEKPP